jgi:multicomponent Na+:H+ antiporter subunit D
MHALGKITLFFVAGAVYVVAHKTEVSQLDGLGRRMPFTFAAYFVASLSIIGLPPLGGAWSKWFLVLGAVDAGQPWMVVVYLVSSLLSIGYLMPVIVRAFFRPLPAGEDAEVGIKEAPLLMLLPLCATALACFVIFFQADAVYRLLAPVVGMGD